MNRLRSLSFILAAVFALCTSACVTTESTATGLTANAVADASIAFRTDQADKMIHADPQGAYDEIYLKNYNHPKRPISVLTEKPDTWSFSGKSNDSRTWVWKRNGRVQKHEIHPNGEFKYLGKVPGFIYHAAQGRMGQRPGEVITFSWSPSDNEIMGATPIALRKD